MDIRIEEEISQSILNIMSEWRVSGDALVVQCLQFSSKPMEKI